MACCWSGTMLFFVFVLLISHECVGIRLDYITCHFRCSQTPSSITLDIASILGNCKEELFVKLEKRNK